MGMCDVHHQEELCETCETMENIRGKGFKRVKTQISQKEEMREDDK